MLLHEASTLVAIFLTVVVVGVVIFITIASPV